MLAGTAPTRSQRHATSAEVAGKRPSTGSPDPFHRGYRQAFVPLGVDRRRLDALVTDHGPRRVDPKFLPEFGGRTVPELVRVPGGDPGPPASDGHGLAIGVPGVAGTRGPLGIPLALA